MNNRSTEYLVTFHVVRGPLTAVDVTYANGSEVTKPVARPESGIFLPPSSRFGENVTGVEPATPTEVARWSAIVRPESAVSLPLPVERRNVTLLVVVRNATTERPRVVTAAMEWCDPLHTELLAFELHLREGLREFYGSGRCG